MIIDNNQLYKEYELYCINILMGIIMRCPQLAWGDFFVGSDQKSLKWESRFQFPKTVIQSPQILEK